MIGKKVFGKTAKGAAKRATKKALQTFATKTGEYAGEKAGDKIVQLLSKKNKKTITPSTASPIEKPHLETALNTTVANNANQKKDGYRFVVDNSGEVTPFDWYK